MREILLATRNPGKIKELAPVLDGVVDEIITLFDVHKPVEITETGITFEENAVLKAETIFKQYRIIALADDSGLEIDALHGQPGVRSARFAGENASDAENNEKLLRLMHDVPIEKRQGRFKCVMACAAPDKTYTFTGVVEGTIALSLSGSNGFGYDPLFIPEGWDKTFAELGNDVKSRISHRSRAITKVIKFLQDCKDFH